MSFEEFWHIQAAPTAQEAFDILVAEARHTYGHRPGETGTIGDLTGVGGVYDANGDPVPPVSPDRAKQLADDHGYGDADIAYAIELEAGPDEPRRWFVFGKAHY